MTRHNATRLFGLSLKYFGRVKVQPPTPEPKGNRGCKNVLGFTVPRVIGVSRVSHPTAGKPPAARHFIESAKELVPTTVGFPWQRAGSGSGKMPPASRSKRNGRKNRSLVNALGQSA